MFKVFWRDLPKMAETIWDICCVKFESSVVASARDASAVSARVTREASLISPSFLLPLKILLQLLIFRDAEFKFGVSLLNFNLLGCQAVVQVSNLRFKLTYGGLYCTG